MQSLEHIAWKLSEIWSILCLGVNFVFWRQFFFFNSRREIWSTMQNLELLAWKLSDLWSILCFGGHSIFWWPLCFLRKSCRRSIWTTMQNMELENGESYDQFYVLEAILFFSAHFVFLKLFLQKGNMIYQAKSGSPSLKIEWVMINVVFWQPFCFFVNYSCRWLLWTTMQNLELLAWKLSELCSILCFGGHLVSWRPFCFCFEIFLQKINIYYHAKSGAHSMKIE